MVDLLRCLTSCRGSLVVVVAVAVAVAVAAAVVVIIWGHIGQAWGYLKVIFGQLVAIAEPSCAILELYRCHIGPPSICSWAILGIILEPFGVILGLA